MAGLYIHIPYCRSKCYYCDFYSGSGLGRQDEFVNLLLSEFSLRKDEIKEPFTTVYVGGGTPSSLSSGQLEILLQKIGEMVDLKKITEYTVEVNPEDVTAELLTMLKRYGVNRVSMGIQSLIDEELTGVGRRHTAAKAVESMKLIARYFLNYSVDIMFGLPGQTVESLNKTLSGMLSLRPPHVSIYLLSYEPGTRLYARLQSGKITEVDETTAQEMYMLISGTLAQAGYNHYEISNYALPGFESKHNSSYWFSVSYLGLGPSAHSFDGDTRRYNPSSLSRYIESLSMSQTVYEIDMETEDNKLNDIIITRLRTRVGLGTEDVGVEKFALIKESVDRLLQRGELERVGAKVRIPADKWLVSDNILREIIV